MIYQLGGNRMKEKAYKSMGSAGAANLVIGICAVIGGVAAGILLIIQGGKLLANRSHLEL